MKKELTKKVTTSSSPTPSGSPSGRGRAIQIRTLESMNKKTIDAPAYFISVPLSLIARTIHTINKRMRVRTAHTKERAEVRGGGRKPWKQKGTGRSRHGSSRSPLWVGGGITFGPRSRKQRVLRGQLKERRRALAGAFALHMNNESLLVLQLPKEIASKTNDLAKQFKGTRSVLIVLDDSHALLARGIRNIPTIRCKEARSVTPLDILEASQVWIDEAAMPVIEKRCAI